MNAIGVVEKESSNEEPPDLKFGMDKSIKKRTFVGGLQLRFALISPLLLTERDMFL